MNHLSRTRSTWLAAAVSTVAVLSAGVVVAPKPPTLQSSVTGDQQLAAAVRPLLTGPADSVSVALIEADGSTRTADFGADADTPFEIGSITKTFTSALLADAVDRGEVSLDERVGQLLPLDGSAVADVTLGELASHRSGLPRLSTRLSDSLPTALAVLLHRNPYTADAEGVVDQARAATLTNRGSYSYSNLGAALLGQALAARAGMSYPQLLGDRMLQPLGLRQTTVPLTGAEVPSDALTGYSAGGAPEQAWAMGGAAPAGGIRSTANDLAVYAKALLAGTAPGASALDPRWAASGDNRIGLAWITTDIGGTTYTWHNGGTGGFSSILVLDRASGRAAIVLSNTAASVDSVGFALLQNEGLSS